MRYTDYQSLILSCAALMNVVCCGLVIYVCYIILRFKEFREGLVQAIQNGDGIFHWIDAKSFGFFVAGWLSAWFTMNITFVFVYAKMFEIGPMSFIGLFVGVTFTLWGIAWRK